MLISILILACIVAVASLYNRGSEVANRVVCAENLRRLSQAVSMYREENDGKYPVEDSWTHALLPYLDHIDTFFCPSDSGIRPKKHTGRGIDSISYWYRQPSDSSVSTSDQIICGDHMYTIDMGNHPDGGNVSYLDGHVHWKTSAQWKSENLPLELATHK
jgi:prepilin-type processing-associated H-X9-DG protein